MKEKFVKSKNNLHATHLYTHAHMKHHTEHISDTLNFINVFVLIKKKERKQQQGQMKNLFLSLSLFHPGSLISGRPVLFSSHFTLNLPIPFYASFSFYAPAHSYFSTRGNHYYDEQKENEGIECLC